MSGIDLMSDSNITRVGSLLANISTSMAKAHILTFAIRKVYWDVWIVRLAAWISGACTQRCNVLFPQNARSITLITAANLVSFLLYGKQIFGQIRCSDWLPFGWDFTVRTITMKTVRLCIFFSFTPGKFKVTRNTKRKKEMEI